MKYLGKKNKNMAIMIVTNGNHIEFIEQLIAQKFLKKNLKYLKKNFFQNQLIILSQKEKNIKKK